MIQNNNREANISASVTCSSAAARCDSLPVATMQGQFEHSVLTTESREALSPFNAAYQDNFELFPTLSFARYGSKSNECGRKHCRRAHRA